MGGAFKGLGAGLMGPVGGPMGLFMIALPVLISAFTALYKKSPGFRKFVDGLVNGFKSLMKALAPVGAFLLKVFNDFFNWLNTKMPAIKKFFGDTFSAIGGFINDVLVPAFQKALPIIQNVLGFIADAAGVAFNAIKFYITNILIPYYKLIWVGLS